MPKQHADYARHAAALFMHTRLLKNDQPLFVAQISYQNHPA
jgi:hypothetical protein